MMNLYYKIWVDCILKAQSQPNNKNNWKFFTMVFMSMPMAINIAVFMAILQRNILGHFFYDIRISSLEGTRTGAFLSFFILFLLLPLLINYLLIFKNNRYEQLVKKYKYHNGKLFISYFLTSLLLPFILLFLGYLWDKVGSW